MKTKTKKTKLQSLSQTDGEHLEAVTEQPRRARSLDELFGSHGRKRYDYTDIETYRNWLNTLNLVDLQDHAINLGFAASGERHRLINRLSQEFQFYQSQMHGVVQRPVSNKPIDPTIAKILSQGR